MVMDSGSDNAGQDKAGCDATGRSAAGKAGPGFSDPDPDQPGEAAAPDPPTQDDPRSLAQDWITLWQSELSAMAADPEIRESWQTVMALWAGTMSTMLRGLPREQTASRRDRARGHARPADAPRAPAAAAAPDPRDAEIERLARHVVALERRLAELARLVEIDRRRDPAVDPKLRPKRRPGRKPGR